MYVALGISTEVSAPAVLSFTRVYVYFSNAYSSYQCSIFCSIGVGQLSHHTVLQVCVCAHGQKIIVLHAGPI